MRIFIALLFPENIKNTIFDYLEETEEIAINGNFTDYNNLHLTLLYIGEVADDLLNKIKSKLNEISMEKFNFTTTKLGMFKKSKNKRIVYLGVNKSFALQRLYNLVRLKLKEINIDFPTENYTPHITLARQVSLIADEDIEQIKTQPLEIKAERISIMQSTRIDGELTYIEIDSVRLK